MRGMQIAGAGIAGEANGGPELESMILLGPGEIIEKVMRAHLEIMAISDSLIQPQKSVPRLVGITHHAKALPCVSPVKGIGESGAKNGGVAQCEAFTVVGGGLLGSISRKEGSSRVPQILRGAAPEQEVPAVGGKAVIRARDEDIVIQAGGGAENEAGIVQTIARRRIVGHRLTLAEDLIQVASVIGQVEHGGINPDVTRVKVFQVGRRKGCNSAVHILIPEDSLAESGRGNDALGTLLLSLTRSLVISEEKQAVLPKWSTHR